MTQCSVQLHSLLLRSYFIKIFVNKNPCSWTQKADWKLISFSSSLSKWWDEGWETSDGVFPTRPEVLSIVLTLTSIPMASLTLRSSSVVLFPTATTAHNLPQHKRRQKKFETSEKTEKSWKENFLFSSRLSRATIYGFS